MAFASLFPYAMRLRMKKTRVLIVDDHPLLRVGIVQLLSVHNDLEVCGEVDDGRKTIEAIRQTKPDVVILDITLGDRNGLDVLKDIHVHSPEIKVLILSMHDELLYAPRAIRSGAAGYINKTQAPDNLITAIRTVLNGKIWLSVEMKKRFLAGFTGNAKAAGTPTVEILSDRELEVLERIGRGIGTREIARNFGLSVKTIESHRANIKEKLNLRTAPELVRYAIRWVKNEGSPVSPAE